MIPSILPDSLCWMQHAGSECFGPFHLINKSCCNLYLNIWNQLSLSFHLTCFVLNTSDTVGLASSGSAHSTIFCPNLLGKIHSVSRWNVLNLNFLTGRFAGVEARDSAVQNPSYHLRALLGTPTCTAALSSMWGSNMIQPIKLGHQSMRYNVVLALLIIEQTRGQTVLSNGPNCCSKWFSADRSMDHRLIISGAMTAMPCHAMHAYIWLQPSEKFRTHR